MISHEKELEVKHLIDTTTLSCREIAFRCGVSRGTVSRIAKHGFLSKSQCGKLKQFVNEKIPAVICKECGCVAPPPCPKCAGDRVRRLQLHPTIDEAMFDDLIEYNAGPTHGDPSPREIRERARAIRERNDAEHRASVLHGMEMAAENKQKLLIKQRQQQKKKPGRKFKRKSTCTERY